MKDNNVLLEPFRMMPKYYKCDLFVTGKGTKFDYFPSGPMPKYKYY
jgi:hypothetical protein